MHNRIHDLVIDLAVQCVCPGPWGTAHCVYGRVRHRLWGTCNNRTIVPHKEIQWHNGTPQEKF